MNRFPVSALFASSALLLALMIGACSNNSELGPIRQPVPPTTPPTPSTPVTTTTTTSTTTSSSSTTTTSNTIAVGAGVPEVFKKMYGASQVYLEGNYVVIKSNGLPDHKSPYYNNTQWASALYVADTRAGFIQNRNVISSFNFTFKIPLNPAETANHRTLGAATIGVAINGVPIFNQYQAQGNLLTPGKDEYVSFDLYNGHPTPMSEYHYHVEPTYLTTTKGSSALVGFLLDGFPLYGPVENGKTLVSSNLDAYHGHFGPTADYPNGIYHYHITADAPYINGNGFYGTAGTWSK